MSPLRLECHLHLVRTPTRVSHHINTLCRFNADALVINVCLLLPFLRSLESISRSFAACTSVLLGDGLPAWPGDASLLPLPAAVASMAKTIEAHRGLWRCLADVDVTTIPVLAEVGRQELCFLGQTCPFVHVIVVVFAY